MKKQFGLMVAAVIALIATNTFASSAEVSPVLVNVPVTEVNSQGIVLSSKGVFGPIVQSDVLVGIPVKVSTGSACIEYVGQEVEKTDGQISIQTKGRTNPMQDACIDIFPMPIDTLLTITFRTSPMLPVAILTKRLNINGKRYLVELDQTSQRVSVRNPEYL